VIGFAGLSHLGINYSLATAAKGFEVVAFHPESRQVAALRRGKFPVEEPGLAELHRKCQGRIRYTAKAGALSGCELVFVSLDVQTDGSNRSDTTQLLALIHQVAPHIDRGATLVLLSQVSPGFTRKLREDLLRSSKIGKIFYQVETLIFGRAVERALRPERYMVGLADPAEPLPRCFRRWHESFGCPVLKMRYESAELAKIAINFFLVSSVSTTNTLAEVCENLGADWNEISPALRLDARIGPKAYLTPGLGIAGGNLERDLVTVKRLAKGGRLDTGVIDAWQRNSAHRKRWTSATLRRALARRGCRIKGAIVGVLGLAYKESTHSTKNSPALEFIAGVPECRVQAYDPVVKLRSGPRGRFRRVRSPLAACRGAVAMVIPTPWPEFRGLDLEKIRGVMAGAVILDPFGLLNAARATALGFDYYRLGAPGQNSSCSS